MDRYEYTLVLRSLIFEGRGKSLLSPSNWYYHYLVTVNESSLALDSNCDHAICLLFMLFLLGRSPGYEALYAFP